MSGFLIHDESEHDAPEQQPGDLGVLRQEVVVNEVVVGTTTASRFATKPEKPQQLQEERCSEEIRFFLGTSQMPTYLAFEQLLGARVLFGLHDS